MKSQTSKIVTSLGASLAVTMTVQAQYVYTALDEPLASHGTFPNGIDGTNIVGSYDDSLGYSHGFLRGGNAWGTLRDPLEGGGYDGTSVSGISGTNIVGYYYTGQFSQAHGFVYDGVNWTDLDDPLAGPDGDTYANGISGANVVGSYDESNGDTSHGFSYNGTIWTSLDHPLAGYKGTEPAAIYGTSVVGAYYDASGNRHAFLYDGSAWATLDHPLSAGDTFASGISGMNIVGFYRDNDSRYHGFLYNGDTWTTLDHPLAANGDTLAFGIDGSNIIGSYTVNGNFHGFLATPIPRLSITRSVDILKVSWPYPSTGWALQQNSDLTTTNWATVGGASDDGTNNFTSIVLTAGNLFFRLSHP